VNHEVESAIGIINKWLKRPFRTLTGAEIAVKSCGMKRYRFLPKKEHRPGASAPVGDFFTPIESPSGSIFLPIP
jgi:hypothetical protein